MQKEKFILKKCEGGFNLVPDNPDNHPLLSKLWGKGYTINAVAPYNTVEKMTNVIKDVANRMKISVNVCGDLKTNPTFIAYYQPEKQSPPPVMVFDQFDGDGSHCGITDLYDEREVALREILKTSLPFDTGWWASKKEIWSARVRRDKTNGPLYLEASAGMDSDYDLVDTAFWSAAGGNDNAGSGSEALTKAGVKEADQDSVIESVVLACELSEDNYASREQRLRWNCGYDRVMSELSNLLDEATDELEAQYQSVVETCKWKLEQLKGEQ